MSKKKLKSGLDLKGISPNILLKHVENTAPFLFAGELKTSTKETAYLEKLRFYKKNLKQLQNIDLLEYFHLCLCAHWATAGTFVPTDVDDQIREGLWKHSSIQKYIDKMALLTIESWSWDYTQVTNRKSYNREGHNVMSTHEGTWLSVAIGAYCALIKNKQNSRANDIADVILSEISKEENILTQLREERDAINFLKTAPLMAHNFGDLDRVMVQWKMDQNNSFCKKIFKLGHALNENYSPILAYTGRVNKEFCSKENHRHLSMRVPKCLRRSSQFLIPVGPFMDDWGNVLGETELLSLDEKALIVSALFDGFQRQEQAIGYARAFGAMMSTFAQGLNTLEEYLPFDLYKSIQKSAFLTISKQHKEEFEREYVNKLEDFSCPLTKIQF